MPSVITDGIVNRPYSERTKWSLFANFQGILLLHEALSVRIKLGRRLFSRQRSVMMMVVMLMMIFWSRCALLLNFLILATLGIFMFIHTTPKSLRGMVSLVILGKNELVKAWGQTACRINDCRLTTCTSSSLLCSWTQLPYTRSVLAGSLRR